MMQLNERMINKPKDVELSLLTTQEHICRITS